MGKWEGCDVMGRVAGLQGWWCKRGSGKGMGKGAKGRGGRWRELLSGEGVESGGRMQQRGGRGGVQRRGWK